MKIVDKRFSDRKLDSKKKVKDNPVGFLEMVLQSDPADEDISVDIDGLEEKDIKNLSGLIDETGNVLADNPTPANFLKYKKYIKLFLRAMQENMEIKDTLSKRGFNNTKLYKTIEMIDKNLTELAQKVMQKEQSRVVYMELVENIRGLIVDMMM